MASARHEQFPSHLLFGKLWKGQKPKGSLFKNQSDLASVIALIEGAFYHNRAGTVRALLSQVLRHGGDRRSKPLSDDLRGDIFRAVEQRVTEAFVREAFEQEFDEAFENLRTQRREGDSMSASQLEEELEAVSNRARSHWIVTRQPAELHSNHFGEKLVERMIEAVLVKKASYTFFFAGELVAKRFWKAVRDRMEELDSEQDPPDSKSLGKPVDERLSELNSVDGIQVFWHDNKLLFPIPYVIFDHDSSEPIGFVLHYHDVNQVSISKMLPDDLVYWQDTIYPVLADQRKEGVLHELTYDKARTQRV